MLLYTFIPILADVAELVDALDSGSSGHLPVEVQVLSSAPYSQTTQIRIFLPLSTPPTASYDRIAFGHSGK